MPEDKKGFVLYKDWAITILEHMDDKVDPLNPSEAGLLLKAILKYQAFGEDSRHDLPKHIRYLFKNVVDVFNRDLEKWEATRVKRRESGKLGGLAKASKPSKCYDLPREEKLTLSEQVPKTENEPPAIAKPAKAPCLFDEFYGVYPKKVGRQLAVKAYNKAIKEVSHESIMKGLRQYKADIFTKGTEAQFIKHPSTWLNQGCWDDEYGTASFAYHGDTQTPVVSFVETFKQAVGDKGYFIHNGEKIKLSQITQILDYSDTRYMVGINISHIEEFITVDLKDLKYA